MSTGSGYRRREAHRDASTTDKVPAPAIGIDHDAVPGIEPTRPSALGAALVVLACGASTASGAFPGRNGRIVYEVSAEVGGGAVESRLVSVTPLGRRPKELGIGSEPAYSPNGDWIAYRREQGGRGIGMLHASGRGRVRRLTGGLLDEEPDWSPTAGRLAFVRGSEIRIYHRHRSRRLTEGRDPAWSSRNRILFFREDGLYVIRPNGTGLRRVSARQAVIHGGSADWSPDGRWIVVQTSGPGLDSYGDIATMRADGSGFRRLTRSGLNTAPSFSPDGQSIVFGHDEYIAVMSADGKRWRRIRTVYGDWLATDWQPRRRSGTAADGSAGVRVIGIGVSDDAIVDEGGDSFGPVGVTRLHGVVVDGSPRAECLAVRNARLQQLGLRIEAFWFT